MLCKIHDLPLQLICDEYLCGMCYEGILHKEKSHAPKDLEELVKIPHPNGHKGKFMWVKKSTVKAP